MEKHGTDGSIWDYSGIDDNMLPFLSLFNNKTRILCLRVGIAFLALFVIPFTTLTVLTPVLVTLTFGIGRNNAQIKNLALAYRLLLKP